MRPEADDSSAILRRVPSGRQQHDGALAAAPAPGTASAAGEQPRGGWDNDHEDDTRSEMGNENFKARLSARECLPPQATHMAMRAMTFRRSSRWLCAMLEHSTTRCAPPAAPPWLGETPRADQAAPASQPKRPDRRRSIACVFAVIIGVVFGIAACAAQFAVGQ